MNSLMAKKRSYKRGHKISPFPCFKIILILLLAVGLALLYVWQRVTVIKYAQKIEGLKTQFSACKGEYKYLSFEVAQLSSAKNIQRIAQNRLDMLPASSQQISFLLEPNSSQKPTGFLAKVKKMAQNMTHLSEIKVEAKEVKHDL